MPSLLVVETPLHGVIPEKPFTERLHGLLCGLLIKELLKFREQFPNFIW
jgi:hypothetical protein